MIEFSNVGIAYDGKYILRNFYLSVDQGEKVVIAGASGKGKTSVLKTIPGFVIPAEGEVYVDGKTMNAKNIKDIRGITGWLPQSLHLDLVNVEDLLNFPFTFDSNKKSKPAQEQIQDIFTKLGLKPDLLTQRTDEISGGQKQRVILASLFLMKKKILLLDEPTSALDKDAVDQVIRVIQNLSDVTVLSVSHDPLWMNEMDRIIEI